MLGNLTKCPGTWQIARLVTYEMAWQCGLILENVFICVLGNRNVLGVGLAFTAMRLEWGILIAACMAMEYAPSIQVTNSLNFTLIH